VKDAEQTEELKKNREGESPASFTHLDFETRARQEDSPKIFERCASKPVIGKSNHERARRKPAG
jgi:hypothetical protein